MAIIRLLYLIREIYNSYLMRSFLVNRVITREVPNFSHPVLKASSGVLYTMITLGFNELQSVFSMT